METKLNRQRQLKYLKKKERLKQREEGGKMWSSDGGSDSDEELKPP